MVLWLYEKEGSSSLYEATLPGLMARDILVVETFLIYHVTSREHMFKGLCDFFVSHHFVKFNDHRPSGSKDVTDVTVFPIWKSL